MKRVWVMTLMLCVLGYSVVWAQQPAEGLSLAGEIGSATLGAVAGLTVGFVVDATGLSEITGTDLGQSLGLTLGTVAGLQGFGLISGVRGNLLVSALGAMAGQHLSGTLLGPVLMPRLIAGELSPAQYGFYQSVGAVVGAVLLGVLGNHQ